MSLPRVLSSDLLGGMVTRIGLMVGGALVFFKLVFSCPCTAPQETALHCWLYMFLPVGALFFILLCMDAQLMKTCRCSVCSCRCCQACSGPACLCCADDYRYYPVWSGPEGWHYLGLICNHLLKMLFGGSLWVIVAFLGGDWYVCMRTINPNSTNGQSQIACADIPTAEEAETLRKYTSESRVIALGLILGLSVVGTVLYSLSICWKPFYKSLYEVHLEQQTCAILEARLLEQARERASGLTGEALRNLLNLERTVTQGDGPRCQNQQQGGAIDKLWREISRPGFHLATPPE